jgi:hypothetical protein
MEEKITEKDIIGVMDLFTKVPIILLKGAILRNMNVVKRFEDQIISYKTKLSLEELEKIELVTKMPVTELQRLLLSVYEKTEKKQFKLLADPNAQKFISINLNELRKILFP